MSEAKTVCTKGAVALGCWDLLWPVQVRLGFSVRTANGAGTWGCHEPGAETEPLAGAGTSEERCSRGRRARPIQPNFYCLWMRKTFLCRDPGKDPRVPSKMPEFPADLEYHWVWEVPTWNTDTFSQLQNNITQGNSACATVVLATVVFVRAAGWE